MIICIFVTIFYITALQSTKHDAFSFLLCLESASKNALPYSAMHKNRGVVPKWGNGIGP